MYLKNGKMLNALKSENTNNNFKINNGIMLQSIFHIFVLKIVKYLK